MRTCLAMFGLLLLAGCDRREPGAVGADSAPRAAEFKKGHGLLISAEAADFIGLRKEPVGAGGANPSVPRAAVFETADGAFAYVVNGERLLRTPVKLGAYDGARVAVVDGLLEGDVIAVSGVRYLWLAELQATKGGVGCADGH